METILDSMKLVNLKQKYDFLFGKKKPIHEKTPIQVMNRDLKHTCKICNLPYNIKFHSFRINVISNLLKITTVQNTTLLVTGMFDLQWLTESRHYPILYASTAKKLGASSPICEQFNML